MARVISKKTSTSQYKAAVKAYFRNGTASSRVAGLKKAGFVPVKPHARKSPKSK